MVSEQEIAASREEYEALPTTEWVKVRFFRKTGGYVAKHILKTKDDLAIAGIAAEEKACRKLAASGKHVLRLPENIPDQIDTIVINNISYREILKFKPGETIPRGYPDAYFDDQTWDFKTSSFNNEDTLRHRIKEGRKADNVIFIASKNHESNIAAIKTAIGREAGSRAKDGTWKELPNIYYLVSNQLIAIWKKK